MAREWDAELCVCVRIYMLADLKLLGVPHGPQFADMISALKAWEVRACAS